MYPPLATPDDAVAFDYDVLTVLPKLQLASERVRGYLAGRKRAASLFSATPVVPPPLAELVCSIANRMASTPASVAQGVQAEQSGPDQITYGAQAYAGVSGLNQAERDALDRLYPKGSFTADVVCE